MERKANIKIPIFFIHVLKTENCFEMVSIHFQAMNTWLCATAWSGQAVLDNLIGIQRVKDKFSHVPHTKHATRNVYNVKRNEI